jgi:hypothetical protein
MAIIGMISATSLKIGGASEIEHQVHHNDSQQGALLQQGGVGSVLWRGHLGRLGGQPSSKQATLISMAAPAILKNLFRFIIPS